MIQTITYHGTSIRILQPRHVPARRLPIPTFQLGKPSICLASGETCSNCPFRTDDSCRPSIARVHADLPNTHPELFL